MFTRRRPSTYIIPEQPERFQKPVLVVQLVPPPVMGGPLNAVTHVGDAQVVVDEPLETDPSQR